MTRDINLYVLYVIYIFIYIHIYLYHINLSVFRYKWFYQFVFIMPNWRHEFPNFFLTSSILSRPKLLQIGKPNGFSFLNPPSPVVSISGNSPVPSLHSNCLNWGILITPNITTSSNLISLNPINPPFTGSLSGFWENKLSLIPSYLKLLVLSCGHNWNRRTSQPWLTRPFSIQILTNFPSSSPASSVP